MRSLLGFTGVVVVLTFLSCGKDVTAPEPGLPSDVAGDWTFDAFVFTAQGTLECEEYGTATISRSGANLSGTAHHHHACAVGGVTTDTVVTDALTGSVGSATIRLTFGGCDYHADLYHAPIDSAAGIVTCSTPVGGSLGALSGIWSASFQVPPPTIAGSIIIPPGDVLAVTGDTIKVVLSAHDRHGLTWVGYGLVPAPGVADSFAVHDSVFTDTIAHIVPASWDGTSYLDVWARNSYHQLAWLDVASFVVLNAVRHPYQSVSLGVRAADAAYDPVRNLMYFTEPDSARVAVLGLSTFTFGAPIHLPMIKRGLSVQGIDVLPGGDTVMVALPDTAQLALLDRLADTVTTSRITGISGPQWLRTSANRKAFTIGQVDSAGSTFSVVVERDLATGRDSIRREVGHVNATANLWGSPDHSKVLVINVTAYPSPTCLYLYDAATDGFSSCSAPGTIASLSATATTTGNKWYVGNWLLDGSLNLLATVGYKFYAGISPDGSVAFVPTWYGYDKIALPSGAVLERARIQVTAQRITVFPDGKRLFMWDGGGFGTNHATVVDLTH
jgi:hypothetical protein